VFRPDAAPSNEDAWVESLPALQDGEFLIDLKLQGGRGVFCVKELTWYDALAVEQHAFRKNSGGEYFSGEYERRETLRKALVWAAEWPSQRLVRNQRGAILSRLHYDLMELLWPRYFALITPSADEANALYSSALAYFKGAAQEGYPTPPIVVEVDMMLKFGGMTRAELRSIPYSEMERLQLVLMARAEAVVPMPYASADGSGGGTVGGSLIRDDDTAGMPAWMMPNPNTPSV